MALEPVLRFLHIAGVTLWVGGMFFAYVCLRPVAGALLDPPPRLRLWRDVLGRFFAWVWAAIALILASGLGMLGQVGFATAPLNWHLMFATGCVMIAIFIYVVFVPYAALGRAVDGGEWKTGGAALGRIRQAVATNLLLGVATIGLATLGRFLV